MRHKYVAETYLEVKIFFPNGVQHYVSATDKTMVGDLRRATLLAPRTKSYNTLFRQSRTLMIRTKSDNSGYIVK